MNKYKPTVDVEGIVEEFDVFLDKYTGKHDRDSWIKQTLYEDTVQVRKDIIVSELRTTLTTLLTQAEEREKRAVEEARREGAWIGFGVSGEGFNGEYVRPSVTEKDIWKVLDEALTPTISSD